MSYEDILYEKQDGIARIVLNRPQVLNALREQTFDELTAAMRDAAEDESVGVVVLTGAGASFCSGGDVKGQSARTRGSGRRLMRKLGVLAMLMKTAGKPIIAAIRGYCLGGGNELQLLCDLTIAAEDAKLGQVGPRVGSVPVWGATQLLPRLVGDKKAREMIFLCPIFDAREAERIGLVNKVVPEAELEAETDRWCQTILDKSPQAIRIAKIALNMESDRAFYAAFAHQSELLTSTYGTAEHREGPQAFLEKRKPDFRRFRGADG